jgi:hypothetical protein
MEEIEQSTNEQVSTCSQFRENYVSRHWIHIEFHFGLPQNKEIYLKIYVKKLKYINNNLFYLPS